jgi:hypothetical protein
VKRIVLSLAIIIFVTSAIRLPLLNIPFERDEGAYAYIAWRLGHHELPYRDWVDQKPPGIYWVYRLALNLPLEPVRAVHFVGMLFSAASACALYFLARRFLSVSLACGVAVLFAVLSADPRVEGTAANTELFMLFPLILSQLAFLSAANAVRSRIPLMVLCGALTGIAVGFKQVAAVNWFFLVAMYPAFAAGGNRLRDTLAFAAWSAIGAVWVWSFLAIYFYFQNGLDDFIYNVFTHNLGYIQTESWAKRWRLCRHTLTALSRTQVLVWMFAAAGLVALGMTGRRKWLLFLAAWLVTGLIAVGASGFFYPHYFQQTLPVLALAGVLGAEALYGARFWKTLLAAPGRKVVLGATLIILPAIAIFPFIFIYTPAQAVRNIYPGNLFAEMPEIGRRLAQLTGPDDRVFIFGAEPEVLFYAQRVSATRYIFLIPLYGPYKDARDRQMAVASEISDARPAAALYLPNDLFSVPGTEQYLTRWSRSYLQTNFYSNAYLTVDRAGTGRVISSGDALALSNPPGQRRVGVLGLRKAR